MNTRDLVKFFHQNTHTLGPEEDISKIPEVFVEETSPGNQENRVTIKTPIKAVEIREGKVYLRIHSRILPS